MGGAEAKSYISHIKILGEFDLSLSKNRYCVCLCVCSVFKPVDSKFLCGLYLTAMQMVPS